MENSMSSFVFHAFIFFYMPKTYAVYGKTLGHIVYNPVCHSNHVINIHMERANTIHSTPGLSLTLQS